MQRIAGTIVQYIRFYGKQRGIVSWTVLNQGQAAPLMLNSHFIGKPTARLSRIDIVLDANQERVDSPIQISV